MAHEVDRMAYTGAMPWHGLGTPVEGAMTADEALQEGGLNFDVVKQPLWREKVDGDFEKVAGAHCTIRTDRNTVVGAHVGDQYTILQNAACFTFFDALTTRKEAIYHTVGSLRGGSIVWLLAKLPGEIRVKGQDVTEKYLLLTNSHDGTSRAGVLFTPVRVVCMNTLRAALGAGFQYRLRHTTNVEARLQEASRVMGVTNAYYAELQEAFEAMAAKPISVKESVDYLERCLQIDGSDPELSSRSRNMRDEALVLLDRGRGADLPGVRGTVWGAYNAVTEWVDHRKYRNDDARLNNIWFDGQGIATKQRAFDYGMTLALGKELVTA